MSNKLNFFPSECRGLYRGNAGFSYINPGLVVKYLKEKRIDFGFDTTKLNEEQSQNLGMIMRMGTRNLLEIYVLEQDDYIIYMLSMNFSHELGEEPYIKAYLPKFQSIYLPALEKQTGLTLQVEFNGELQVLFVYDKSRDSYCSFEQFNAGRQHKISQLHLEATVYNRGMLALGWKSQILAVAHRFDQHFAKDKYYSVIAMNKCMGNYDCPELEEDESDADYEKRCRQLQSERLELDDLISKFNLYSDDS